MAIHQALRSCGPLSFQTFFSCPSGDSSWRRGAPHADQGELVSGLGYFFSRNVAELNAKFKNPMIQDISRPLRSLFDVWMGPQELHVSFLASEKIQCGRQFTSEPVRRFERGIVSFYTLLPMCPVFGWSNSFFSGSVPSRLTASCCSCSCLCDSTAWE